MDIKKIIKSSPAFIIPSVINLLSLVVFTRLLSLEDYGRLSLALITIEFTQGLLYQWIKLSMMRFYDPNDKSSLVVGLQYNLGVTFILILAVAIAYLINVFLFKIDLLYFAIVALAIVARGLCNYLQDYIRISNTNLNKYTIVSLFSNGSFYIAAIVYVLMVKNPPVENILMMQLAGVFLFLFIYLLKSYKFIFANFRRIVNNKIYKEYVSYGLPLVVVFLASSMFIRIDRYIIEYQVGLKALGSYSAAFSLSNLAINSFFMILTLPTYPEIIRKINEGDTDSAKSIFQKNGNIIFGVGLPILLICCLFSTTFCNLFFGEKGFEIATVFPVVLVGTFLYNFKLHYFDQIFQFARKTNVIMILGIIIGAGHLGLSYFLASSHGAKGVAYSGILLNLASMIFIYYYSKSFFEISFNRKISFGVVVLSTILIYTVFW